MLSTFRSLTVVCWGNGALACGQVTRIKEDSAYVKILIIDGQPTYQNLEGMIRKVNVRETEIDKVQMEKSFIPGDIVKAKLVSAAAVKLPIPLPLRQHIICL